MRGRLLLLLLRFLVNVIMSSCYKQNAILRRLGLTVQVLPKQTVKVFF